MRLRNIVGLGGLLAFSLFASASAHAHGENAPGPNGGVIRMPGAFHVEVKESKPGVFRVHLLDIEFKNPLNGQDSEVTASIMSKGKTTKLQCERKAHAFECVTKDSGAKSGELLIRAKRAGAQGNEAKYPLPLIVPAHVEKTKSSHEGHAHH